MIEFFRITLAGVNIEIECNFRNVFYVCKSYLSKFSQPDLLIRATQSEMEAEFAEVSPFEESYEGVATSRYYGTVETVAVERKIADAMPDFNVFLMHGAVVAKDGYAYMFTAPSGIGKTTRTRLWLSEYPDSIVVNGDKPFLKVTDKEILACGAPWCGKEGWNTNTMVPLRAIFLLERAEKDHIEEISLAKAFPVLLQQTHRPANADSMIKTIQLLQALEGKIHIYKFCSTPTVEAVRLAYETAILK